MPRLVMLTKKGDETGFAVTPHAYETDEAQDGSGKTWQEAGYKLGHYADTREPYKAEPKPTAARAERDEAKADEKK